MKPTSLRRRYEIDKKGCKTGNVREEGELGRKTAIKAAAQACVNKAGDHDVNPGLRIVGKPGLSLFDP